MNAHSDKANLLPVQPKGPWRGNQLGALLIDSGKITPEDAEKVLRYSREHNLRFGDAAVRLGLVSKEQVERMVAYQFDYPYLTPGESLVGTEVVAAYAPFSKQVEALRALRSQLLVRWFDNGLEQRQLAVTSADRGDGRSYLAANLSVVFSQLGERTLLIDADLRHPRQHQIFGLSNAVGLSSLLSGRAELNTAQQVPLLASLSVLTSGPIPPNPQELLNRQAFSDLLTMAAESYEVVLIDTPAASLAADGCMVAGRARGALLVSRMHKTKVVRLRSLAEELSSAGATLVGSVLNER